MSDYVAVPVPIGTLVYQWNPQTYEQVGSGHSVIALVMHPETDASYAILADGSYLRLVEHVHEVNLGPSPEDIANDEECADDRAVALAIRITQATNPQGETDV